MDCKFIVTCKCGCRTELLTGSGKWPAVGRFLCPNCRESMDDGLYQSLAAAEGALAVVPNGDSNFSVAINPLGKDAPLDPSR